MEILKIRKFEFIVHFIFYSIPLVFFLLTFLFYIYNCGVQIKDLLFLVVISPLTFFVVIVINYYLYDKDTVITIDENGMVAYNNNNNKMYFHLQDIDLCEEFSTKVIGYTKITLKDGNSFYVTDYISLHSIYKLNSNIKKEHFFGFFRPKILRREKLVTIPDNHQN